MRKDQIFVLLLVVLLPMSVCFGGAVGDAEGAENESTTIVNNYYNNTTLVEPKTTPPSVLYVPADTIGNITTASGELVEVLEVWINNNNDTDSHTDYRYFASTDFMCSSHTTMQTASGIGVSLTYGDFSSDWLPSDGTSCTYTFDRTGTHNDGFGPNEMGDLYIIYKIH